MFLIILYADVHFYPKLAVQTIQLPFNVVIVIVTSIMFQNISELSTASTELDEWFRHKFQNRNWCVDYQILFIYKLKLHQILVQIHQYIFVNSSLLQTDYGDVNITVWQLQASVTTSK